LSGGPYRGKCLLGIVKLVEPLAIVLVPEQELKVFGSVFDVLKIVHKVVGGARL
jgi:hypothetical protein